MKLFSFIHTSFLAFLLVFYVSSGIHAQDNHLKINGILTDSENRQPIAEAVISIKNSNIVTKTDQNGIFLLETYNELPVDIVVSHAGYQVYEYTVANRDTIVISLKKQSVIVDEVVVVTARRREETVQEIPIPISVVNGSRIEETGSFNVNRIKELIPTVQLYSSNPRNTSLNIRGTGSTFGLTNDGIDPGVGFYVDGVYYARPAVTTLDLIDIEQVEVLRGPQGTLFGKNTTSGAFNVTTRKPSFTPGANFEVSYGNYGYIQAKSSVTAPIVKNKLAGRLSFSGTQRDGLLYNVSTQKHVNDLNNLGFRAQLLYTPSDNIKINLTGDATRQRPDGYAQVVAGVVKTQLPEYRQFDQIISDLNYSLPSLNPFDRIIDHNTSWRSGNDLGGISLNVDAKIGAGTLTSTTAWRYWHWDPSNDRDFTGLPLLTLSQAPSRHQQWSQEVRYAGKLSSRVSGVIGVFVIGQHLKSDPVHTEESGSAQWRFSQNSTSPLWSTPGLFDGYGIHTRSELNSFSSAIFAQVDWEIINGLHLLPGIRYNYDKKDVDFKRETYGGLETSDPDLIALKNIVYNNQEFKAKADGQNLSGQITLAYKANERLNTFVTYSTGYKPVGVNLGGLPREGGEPMIDLAKIKPEYVAHYEFGIKTQPVKSTILNLTLYHTSINDYQTLVQTPDPGVNRGYLSNAEKVSVTGVEVDASLRLKKYLSLYGAFAFTDGKYVSFENAPVPLEETGAPVPFKDISGGALPGISKWSGSLGGELFLPGEFLNNSGKFFIAFDAFYRSSFSSSPSPSQYLNIDGYTLLNARLGFRAWEGTSIFLWARNLLDKNYFEQLLPASGGAGYYAGVLGDPRTIGITLRYNL